MYVREKRIRRGETTYSYWQVVRGTRVDGKVRQRVVAHIGTAEDREHADIVARAKGLLCGSIGCGFAGSEETVGHPVGVAEEGMQLLLCADHASALRDGETVRAVRYR